MACSHWWLPCDSLVALTASILIMTLFVSLCAGKQDHQSPASLSSLPSNQSFLFLNYFNWASVFGSLFINLSIFLLISLPLISYIYISKMVSLEVIVAGVSSHLLPNTRMTFQSSSIFLLRHCLRISFGLGIRVGVVWQGVEIILKCSSNTTFIIVTVQFNSPL